MSTGFAGTFSDVELRSGETIDEVIVTQDTPVVPCSQSWRQVDGLVFPPTKRWQPDGLQWMSNSQELLTTIYGWSSVGVLIAFFVYYFGSATLNFLLSWFKGVYNPGGQDQHIDFSSNLEIFAYVPQIKLSALPFPLLACDIDALDQGLIGWNDPSQSYDLHNMIFDVPWEGMPRKKLIQKNTRGRALIAQQSDYLGDNDERSGVQQQAEKRKTPMFSIVKHWPPGWRATELEIAKSMEEMSDEDEQ